MAGSVVVVGAGGARPAPHGERDPRGGRARSRTCEATRQPHSSLPCLVELVRADATKGSGDTMTIRPEPGGGPLDPRLSAITNGRRQLIDLAYRLLDSLTDAEDAVQEPSPLVRPARQQQDAIAGGAPSDGR